MIDTPATPAPPRVLWRHQGILLGAHSVVVAIALWLPLPRGETLFGMGMIPSLWGLFVLAVLPLLSLGLFGYILLRACRAGRVRNLFVFLALGLVMTLLVIIACT